MNDHASYIKGLRELVDWLARSGREGGAMEAKIIEVRDEGTVIVCLGVKFRDLTEWQARAIEHSGYGFTDEGRDWYVLLVPLNGGAHEAYTDPYKWHESRGSRTLFKAHLWLRDTGGAWDSLPAEGGVIDVQFVLGETPAPKSSEFLR